jgi:hypothetical protein
MCGEPIVSIDANQDNNRLLLPEGIKLRQHNFGKKPATLLMRVPGDVKLPAGPARPAFEIRWEDKEQGLSATVREQENGQLRAEVSATDISLKQANLSVGLFGNTEAYALVQKTIPFTMVDENGCHGSADLGTLSDAVADLGHEIGMVCCLVV